MNAFGILFFPDFIKGAVTYEHFETPFIKQDQLTDLTQQYDLIVTNVTMKDLVPACPLIAINAFPTAKILIEFNSLLINLTHFYHERNYIMNLRRLLKRDSQRQLQLVETLYYSQHPRSVRNYRQSFNVRYLHF